MRDLGWATTGLTATELSSKLPATAAPDAGASAADDCDKKNLQLAIMMSLQQSNGQSRRDGKENGSSHASGGGSGNTDAEHNQHKRRRIAESASASASISAAALSPSHKINSMQHDPQEQEQQDASTMRASSQRASAQRHGKENDNNSNHKSLYVSTSSFDDDDDDDVDDGPTVMGSTSSRPARLRVPVKFEDNSSSDDTVACPRCNNAVPVQPRGQSRKRTAFTHFSLPSTKATPGQTQRKQLKESVFSGCNTITCTSSAHGGKFHYFCFYCKGNRNCCLPIYVVV